MVAMGEMADTDCSCISSLIMGNVYLLNVAKGMYDVTEATITIVGSYSH